MCVVFMWLHHVISLTGKGSDISVAQDIGYACRDAYSVTYFNLILVAEGFRHTRSIVTTIRLFAAGARIARDEGENSEEVLEVAQGAPEGR